MILLETGRLRLRRFREDDADRLTDLDSDPEVMRYITFGVPTPRATYTELILPRWLSVYEEHPLLGYWAAERHGDGRFVGWFHLRTDRIEPEYLELGYRLQRAAWGQGYATEGGRALVEHGFLRAGAAQISARALHGNRASQRVMEKCGLRPAGTFVYPDDVLPNRSEAERTAVKYALAREQWLANRP